MHLSDSELAALAHGENARLTAESSAHLAACKECTAKLEAMRRSDRELAGLLGLLDHAAPTIRSTQFASSSPYRRRVGAVAAGLALAAAAAAAAVPGSPLHKILIRTVTGTRGESTVSRQPTESVRPDQEAGIAFIPGSSLDVRFRNAESGGQVQIVVVDGEQVSAIATGEAGFSLHQLQLDIDARGRAMSFMLEIPRTLRDVRFEIDDRVVLERRGGVFSGSAAHDPEAPYVFELGAAGGTRRPARRR